MKRRQQQQPQLWPDRQRDRAKVILIFTLIIKLEGTCKHSKPIVTVLFNPRGNQPEYNFLFTFLILITVAINFQEVLRKLLLRIYLKILREKYMDSKQTEFSFSLLYY